MGYTHYFKQTKKVLESEFKNFSDACKKLHENLPKTTDTAGGYMKDEMLEIAGGNGTGKPIFADNHVIFNGKDDLSHETFYIDIENSEPAFNFCKTARKPYDLLVVACLIAANQHIGVVFSSDGFTDYNGIRECNDLLPAMNYYNEVMQPENPITEKMLWEIREKHIR